MARPHISTEFSNQSATVFCKSCHNVRFELLMWMKWHLKISTFVFTEMQRNCFVLHCVNLLKSYLTAIKDIIFKSLLRFTNFNLLIESASSKLTFSWEYSIVFYGHMSTCIYVYICILLFYIYFKINRTSAKTYSIDK